MSKKIKSHKKKLRDEEDESDEEEEEVPVKSRKQQKERSNKLFPFSYFSGEYILRPMITGAALAFGLSIGYTIYDFFAANLKPWLFHGLSALGFIKRASLQ